MTQEEIYKIEEALRILSSESRDTAGLGAPISILKSLIKDSEARPSVLPSVGEYLRDAGTSDVALYSHNKNYNEIWVSELLESYAQLCVQHEREFIKESIMIELLESLNDSHIYECEYQKLRKNILRIFNHGKQRTTNRN